MNAVVADATVFLPASEEKADILLADVPCSGLGVIGRKPDIRYKMTEKKQEDIVKLQRQILDTVWKYVKVGGTLVYSTCTIGAEETSTTSNGSWIIIPSSWKASIPTFQRNYREKPPGRATYSSCRAFMRATAFSWPD